MYFHYPCLRYFSQDHVHPSSPFFPLLAALLRLASRSQGSWPRSICSENAAGHSRSSRKLAPELLGRLQLYDLEADSITALLSPVPGHWASEHTVAHALNHPLGRLNIATRRLPSAPFGQRRLYWRLQLTIL